MSLNKTVKKGRASSAHMNYMGGPCWDINNPIQQLRIVASSCFFGEPTYYGPEKTYYQNSLGQKNVEYLRDTLNAVQPKSWRLKTPRELMEHAIDSALDFNIEETLKLAVELRNDHNIRATPQVIIVRAALHNGTHSTSLIRTYMPKICIRLDEVMNQMAYFESINGSLKEIPSRLKRAWARRLSKANTYELAKYKMTSRNVNLFDAVNLTHPKSDNIDALMRGNIKLGSENKTWESIISGGGSWAEALPVMGHMALLRNLRNLHEHNLLTRDVVQRLIKGVPSGKQLPFRYFSAYKAVESVRVPGYVLDGLEECIDTATMHVPRIPGKTISLVDNSGSAQGTTTSSMGKMTIAEIGNLMGIITGKCTDEGYIGVFGDRLEVLPVKLRTGTFDQLKVADDVAYNIGGSTENGIWLFWDQAIKRNEHWDNIFIYSDMQAGHGGLYGTNSSDYQDFCWPTNPRYIDVPALVNKYRREVNPSVNVFLVQIAGYQDIIIPEFYDKTYILGGWSEKILNFASEMISAEKSNIQ